MFFESLWMKEPGEFNAERVYAWLDAFTRPGNEATLQSTVSKIKILKSV